MAALNNEIEIIAQKNMIEEYFTQYYFQYNAY